MTERLVRLKGHQFDLEELSQHFTSDDLNVRRDEDGHYFLRSSDFGQVSDSSAVEQRGRELVEHINGAAKLLIGSGYWPVKFDAVTEIDESGKRLHRIVLSATAEGRARVTAKPTVIRADGTEDTSQSPDEVEALAALADQNEKVADALRFFARGDWDNLYKAWEVVCDAAGGEPELMKKGWATKTQRRRFTGTAQSHAALGDEARHAPHEKKYKAPKNPMTLDEARTWVRSVIQAWVNTLRHCGG
jgi:hypothetical protein